MKGKMFKRFLIMNNFWIEIRNGTKLYVKPLSTYEEIVAKLVNKGVEVQYKQNKKHFTNLNELKDYLDWITYTQPYNQAGNFPPYY